MKKLIPFIFSLFVLCSISQQAFAEQFYMVPPPKPSPIFVKVNGFLSGGRLALGDAKGPWNFSGGVGVDVGYTGLVYKEILPLFPTASLSWLGHSNGDAAGHSSHLDLFIGGEIPIITGLYLNAQIGFSGLFADVKAPGIGWDIGLGSDFIAVPPLFVAGLRLFYRHSFFYPDGGTISDLNLGVAISLRFI